MRMYYLDGKLHAVSGPDFNPFGVKPTGYIVDMETGNVDGTWQVELTIFLWVWGLFFHTNPAFCIIK